ncbi:MAG TPA: hypothetical protein VFW05_01600, partial [Verrucomicrobiae bacterium]|nr:hypothetical protein [Verrucomicrobiae bacterium]
LRLATLASAPPHPKGVEADGRKTIYRKTFTPPGVPGTIGGPDYSVIEKAALAYLFVAIALLLLSGVQSSFSDRRGAFWSAAFAVLALIIAYGGTFHPHFK